MNEAFGEYFGVGWRSSPEPENPESQALFESLWTGQTYLAFPELAIQGVTALGNLGSPASYGAASCSGSIMPGHNIY